MNRSTGDVPLPSLVKPAVEPWRWGVVWLMFLATMLAYMDRQTMGSTAAYIKGEFRLTEQDYGRLESAFAITFAVFQVPAGFLADRVNVRLLYAAAIIIWSAAGFLTGMVETIGWLMACRLVLGVGEAFNWPCAVGVVRRLMPLEQRALANGIFHSGASIGAVATPLLALIIVGSQGENWRLLFQLTGALGLVWVVLWFLSIHGRRAEAISRPTDPAAAIRADDPAPVPFLRLFALRVFWITLAVSLTVNICWHFYRVWLPRYLNVDLGFSQQDIQWLLIGFFLAADAGAMFFGWLTRRLTQAGLSVETSRKIVLFASAILCMLSTPAMLTASPWVTLPLIFLVAAGSMGGFPIFFALSQEISSRHTSLLLGIFGALAWLVLYLIHPPAGQLADRMGTFVPSLIAVGFVPILGAAVQMFWPEALPRPIPPLPADNRKLPPPSEEIQAAEDRLMEGRPPENK